MPLDLGGEGWTIAAALASRHIGPCLHIYMPTYPSPHFLAVFVYAVFVFLSTCRTPIHTHSPTHNTPGGAVNFVAVTETLGTASELTAAGIAADNLVVALYFGLLFLLARGLPPEAEEEEVGWCFWCVVAHVGGCFLFVWGGF